MDRQAQRGALIGLFLFAPHLRQRLLLLLAFHQFLQALQAQLRRQERLPGFLYTLLLAVHCVGLLSDGVLQASLEL